MSYDSLSMRTILGHLSLAVALTLAGASVASAQAEGEQDARHHFRLGSAHYDSGHFAEAAREFEESYRLSRRPELLNNIYVAHRDAGNAGAAADALERYLAEMPDVENREMLEQRLAGLRRMAAANQSSAATDGGAEANPDDPPTRDASAEVSASHETTTDTTPDTSDGGGGGGGLSPVGFIVAGVGAAALIGGVITGSMALSTQSELESNCPDGVCPPGYDYAGPADSGRTLALLTDILIPVGVAAVAAGVVLIIVLQDGGDESTTAGAACDQHGCMGALRGRF